MPMSFKKKNIEHLNVFYTIVDNKLKLQKDLKQLQILGCVTRQQSVT